MADDGSRQGGDKAADARFEDAFQPVKLIARDAGDLKVVSALLQDAVIAPKNIAFDQKARRFAFLANRFRWEKPGLAERVRAAAHIDNVLSVKAKGVVKAEDAAPLSLLAAAFEPDEEPPGGVVRLAFAGGAEIAVRVEAVEVFLTDASKPWPAAATPAHFS